MSSIVARIFALTPDKQNEVSLGAHSSCNKDSIVLLQFACGKIITRVRSNPPHPAYATYIFLDSVISLVALDSISLLVRLQKSQ